MTNHRSHKRKMHPKPHTARHRQRGGDLAGNPASAWGWVDGTLGNGWTQFMNSLTLQPGQNIAAAQSNDSVPVGNVNAQTAQGMPKAQSGGKTHKRHHKRTAHKRGGNVASVISQAVVPGVLLAAQHTMGRRTRRHHKRHDKRRR